jgi:hypothetical protein
LRLLRGPDDIDDYVHEVAPLAGTMLAFRRSAHSFHGHRPHVGERRMVQLNWVTEPAVLRRELNRHRWSARWKALNPFALQPQTRGEGLASGEKSINCLRDMSWAVNADREQR